MPPANFVEEGEYNSQIYHFLKFVKKTKFTRIHLKNLFGSIMQLMN